MGSIYFLPIVAVLLTFLFLYGNPQIPPVLITNGLLGLIAAIMLKNMNVSKQKQVRSQEQDNK
ncbi:hypothetical protein FLK61_23975 [Paenalkalicoccus suaedae]|uniref:Uncharacterized protein n=1 Tax=Paenalkalicoccus suaedae TaxID=2592382 RepID=A0A859FAM9_9BACI|nr:hypothetical protein [Paenalkalicoccus suaedae]QKS69848.1 hypothetical protein FLK61_23975 [Paenalkalicoccus suaedae]